LGVAILLEYPLIFVGGEQEDEEDGEIGVEE
jgi:hypothetical protein